MTKKQKKTDKKEKKEVITAPDNGMGGFMPDPPENCIFAEDIVEVEGKKYIDNMICYRYCGVLNKCKRKKEFDIQWKEYRKIICKAKPDEQI